MKWEHSIFDHLCGELITLEISEANAKVACDNLAKAGIRNSRVLVENAIETLKELPTVESFDLIFIDADSKATLITFSKRKA